MASASKVLFLAISATLMSGCSLPSIVGEWESVGLMVTNSIAKYTFRADGTLSSTLQINAPGLPFPIVAEAEGTYKVTGDKISSSLTSYTVNGVKVDNLESLSEPVRNEMKRPLQGVYQWVNPNELTIIQGRFGNTIILRRLKPSSNEPDNV